MDTDNKYKRAKTQRSSLTFSNSQKTSVSDKDSSVSTKYTSSRLDITSESVRLNPSVVKKKGLKLYKNGSEGTSSMLVSHSNLIAPTDDYDLEKNHDILIPRKDSSKNIDKRNTKPFTNMFNLPGETDAGCCGCLHSKGPVLKAREECKMPPKRVKWWQVTLYLLNDVNESWLILYSGMIFALYGWVLGTILLVGLWPVNMYVAHLLWRCRNVYHGAISIGDLVYYLTHSSWAMYLTFFVVNLTIATSFAYNTVVAATSVYWLTGFKTEYCYIVFLAGVYLLLLPMTQLRTLHSLTIINGITLVCLLCFVGIYMYFLALGGPAAGAVTRAGPDLAQWQNYLYVGSDQPVTANAIVVIQVLFTSYNYQLLILEIMAEMKDPREFPKANYWCTPVVLFVTLCTGAFRYIYEGEETNLTLVVPFDILSKAFDTGRYTGLAYFGMICLTLKMLGCCLVKSVILTRSIQLLIHPQMANVRTWMSRLEWAGISLFVLGFGFLLSIACKVLLSSITFLGTLTLLCAFVLPIILFIACKSRLKQLKLIPWYEWLLIVAIFASFIVITIVLVYKSVKNVKNLHRQQTNYTNTAFFDITYCKSFK